ncbi:aminotransferase class IV [Mariprofundus erugo]|nr:aminotransferase class IV [Mariprofundus erugo]
MKIEVIGKMERGLGYAEACFETFRVIRGEIFAWPLHAARLQRGLQAFSIGLNDDHLARLYAGCIRAAADHGHDVLIRLTVSGGEAPWGLFAAGGEPVIRIQAMPYHAQLQPVQLTLLEWHHPPAARVAKFTADYALTLRALQGVGHANVLFSHEQQLLCAATANVMIRRGGQWWTPALSAGVLPGIIRQQLILAGVVHEAACPVTWLEDCEAIALTASGFFVRNVGSIISEKGVLMKAGRCDELTTCLAGHAGVPEDMDA